LAYVCTLDNEKAAEYIQADINTIANCFQQSLKLTLNAKK
jgi:hypothetical protein